MNRPFRILRYRWRTVLFVVAATVLVAVWAANLRNEAIEPRFQATAPVTFVNDIQGLESLGTQLAETVQTQLEDAHLQALSVNKDVLGLPGYAVEVDTTLGRLTFLATGSSASDATAHAADMRDRLLALKPFDLAGKLNDQIQVTLSQLGDVRDEIRALQDQTSLDPQIEEQRNQLTTLLGDLEKQALTLEQSIRVPSTLPDAPTQSQLQDQLGQVNSAIADVQNELAALPPGLDPLSAEATQLRVLQGEYDQLEQKYQNLLVQQTDLAGLPLIGAIENQDQTPSQVPLEIAALVALVLGLGLAFAVLVLSERLVAPVWFPADISEIPFLPSVTTRPRGGVSWYLRSGASRRKSAIQAIRSTIRARVGGEDLVVAVAGSGVSSADIQTLGVDLASAFASTAVDTVLVDAAFDATTKQPEFRHAAFLVERCGRGQ